MGLLIMQVEPSYTLAFGAPGAGLSLDPEGRKRLLVRGKLFALKKEKETLITLN